MSMVSLLASLVMIGAGCMAVSAIVVTLRAQLPAVYRLLADSRAIARDREFLVQITAVSAPAAPRITALVLPAAAPRRGPVRLVRQGPATTGPGRPLRAAA
ncbi:MAG: hypothetical protein WCL10_16615 [Novosphingobium sp.]|jgi:hypothetical protein|uniref:hypothetical protein n=1 Tax=Novosphingobium sp. TaxID=1874826 RepID=UPI003019A932